MHIYIHSSQHAELARNKSNKIFQLITIDTPVLQIHT